MSKIKELTYNLNERGKRKLYTKIVAPPDHYQMDLMDMQLVANKKGNHNMTFGLVIIEIHSRFCVCYPLKNKKAETVGGALRGWLDRLKKFKKHPKHITADSGGEFKGVVKTLMDQNDITLRLIPPSDFSKTTTAIVERVIKTIRERIRKYWLENNDFVWVPIIPEVMKEYNASFHRTIKTTPRKAYLEGVQPFINPKKKPEPLKQGAHVRIYIPLKTFEKATAQAKWSNTIYTVKEQVNNLYRLTSPDGSIKKGLYPRWSLRESAFSPQSSNKKPLEAKQAYLKRQKKDKQELKRLGIDEKNIINIPRRRMRERKAPDRLGYGTLGVLSDIRERLRVLFTGRGKTLPSSVKKVLAEYGTKPIEHPITLCREPVQSVITKFANILSFGKFKKKIKSLNYDDVFHLYCVIKVDGKLFRIEKNQSPTIKQISSIPSKAEKLKMPWIANDTLANMFETGIKADGENFIRYSAEKYNCQRFIRKLLALHLTPAGVNFIMQDAEALFSSLPKGTKTVTQFLTDLADRAGKVITGNGR